MIWNIFLSKWNISCLFSRSGLAEPIDVANHVCMTRQALNKKFNISIGRSIHREITRFRMNIARKFLTETNMSISEIAYKRASCLLFHGLSAV